MNFSEFNESLESPLFEKKGETPECPEGYKWNKKLGKCEPKVKAKKNHENPGDKHRSLIGNFNVFGASGMNGDGYALEDGGEAGAEAATEAGAAMSEETVTEMRNDWLTDHKYQKRLADADKAAKEQDDRMRYGKKGKPSDEKPLRRGEVRKFNKETGKYESNK